MAEAETPGMHISMSGVTSVEGLKGPEAMLSVSPLEAASALMTSHLDDVQLTVERMYLGHDIEDAGVGLMVASELGGQSPVIGAAGQVHGLVVGR